MAKQYGQSQLEKTTDSELAAIIISELTVLEAQGVRMPQGWREEPISPQYLDALLTTALSQLKAIRRSK